MRHYLIPSNSFLPVSLLHKTFVPPNLKLTIEPLIGAQVPFLSLGDFDYAIARLSYSDSIVSLVSLLNPSAKHSIFLDYFGRSMSSDSNVKFCIF